MRALKQLYNFGDIQKKIHRHHTTPLSNRTTKQKNEKKERKKTREQQFLVAFLLYPHSQKRHKMPHRLLLYCIVILLEVNLVIGCIWPEVDALFILDSTPQITSFQHRAEIDFLRQVGSKFN